MLETPTLKPIISQLDDKNFNLFSAMEQLADYENYFGEMSANELNLTYLYQHSGTKYCSPLLLHLAKQNDNEHITQEQLLLLSGIIYHRFKPKWKALWDTFTVDYNPIENYNMVETGTNDSTTKNEGSGTEAITHGLTTDVSDTTENDLTETLTHGHEIDVSGSNKHTGNDTHNTTLNTSDKETGTTTETTTTDFGKTETTDGSGSNDTTTTFSNGKVVTTVGNGSEDITTTYTNGKKIVVDGTQNANTDNNVWGFNTTENPVPLNNSVGSGTTKETTTNSGDDKEVKGGKTTDNNTVTNSGTDTQTDSGTTTNHNTVTNGGSDIQTHDTERDLTTAHTGTTDLTDTYNSTEAVENTTVNRGADTTSNLGTVTRTGKTTNSGTDNTQTTNTDTSITNGQTTLKRSGNIGVTTTQQMLQQERDLWLYDYYNTVFSDIDSVIALSVY